MHTYLFQDLGFISVGVKFEPREGLLHVMVDQAKALPQHQLTGPPGESVHLSVRPSDLPSFYPSVCLSVSPPVCL